MGHTATESNSETGGDGAGMMAKDDEHSIHPFAFRGEAGEYFRIWIVNLALSVLTLGIYSAWASVRTRRYFYGNTVVAGTAFVYAARARDILVGRLLLAALVVAFVVGAQLHEAASFVAIGVVAIVAPWVVSRMLSFRSRWSSWRGLGFRFDGSVALAYRYWLLAWLLVPITLGLAWPFVRWLQKRHAVRHHVVGAQRLTFDAPRREFFRVYLLAWLLYVLIVAPVLVLVVRYAMTVGAQAPQALGWLEPIANGAFYVAFAASWTWIATGITNATLNGTRIGPHRLQSSLGVRDMLWLYGSNLVAIALTAGLATPWAQVRMARYRAANLVLVAGGSLDALRGDPANRDGRGGDEAPDFAGLEFGL